MHNLTKSDSTLFTGGQVLRVDEQGIPSFQFVDFRVTGPLITDVGLQLAPCSNDSVRSIAGLHVIPGMINAHTHSYGSLSRATVPPMPLEPWALYTTADTAGRTYEEGYLSAMLSAIESLHCGVTAVLDHLGGSRDSIEGAIAAYREIGLRVVVAPMVSDLLPHNTYGPRLDLPDSLIERLESSRPPTTKDALDLTAALIRAHHNPNDGLLQIFVGPSGPQRSSRDLLLGAAQLAVDHQVGYHTHLLETPIQWSSQLEGQSLTGLLQETGALGPKFSGAHAVWTNFEDARRLAEADATVVSNAFSNLYLGNGVAPYEQWHEAGLRYAIGTDGANCGGSLDMAQAVRLSAVLQHTGPSLDEGWSMMAKTFVDMYDGGAQALGLAGKLGRIDSGFLADFTIINTNHAVFAAEGDEVELVVAGLNESHIRDVFVAGRQLMANRTITFVDESQVLEGAREIRLKLRNPQMRMCADEQFLALCRRYQDASARAHSARNALPEIRKGA